MILRYTYHTSLGQPISYTRLSIGLDLRHSLPIGSTRRIDSRSLALRIFRPLALKPPLIIHSPGKQERNRLLSMACELQTTI